MSLLDYVKARVVEEGDCWIWSLMIVDQTPYGHIGKRRLSIRRELWKNKHGKNVSKGFVIRTKCKDKRCVNPDHFVVVKLSTAAKQVKKSASHVAKITLAKRASSSISDDVVYRIRHSTESERVLSGRYGVSRSYIGKVKRGEIRVPVTNPFQGLMR